MSFSIKWPVMPKLGAVSIHSVGNQNFRTGFDVQYDGPKGRVTLYVNHYLTDDMRLTFMHRENGQYRYSPGFRIEGDAYEAEQAIRQFVEADGKIKRTDCEHTTGPDVWGSYWGAATVAMRSNSEALEQLQSGQKFLQNDKRNRAIIGFGLAFKEMAEAEMEGRNARQKELQGVLDALKGLSRAPTQEVIAAVERPDLKEEIIGFDISPIKPSDQVVKEFYAEEGEGRILFAQTWNHRNHRLYGEGLSLSLMSPEPDPFKWGENVKPADVTDHDLLISRAGATLNFLQRDMAYYQAIYANPRMVILSPNGNIEGRVKDFTPEMFAAPQNAPAI